MSIQVEREAQSNSNVENVTVKLSTHFTVKEYGEIKQLVEGIQLNKHIEELTFDLAETDYMDSCGVGGFVWFYRNYCDKVEHFRLINVNPRIMRLLTMVHLEQFFQIEEAPSF